MRRNKMVAVILSLSIGMLLSGCGRREEAPYITGLQMESYEDPKEELKEDGPNIVQSTAKEELREDEQSIVQSAATEEAEEGTGEENHGRWEYVDFSVVEENHEILEYDICAGPQYDWENTLLGEEEGLRQIAEEYEEYAERWYSKGPQYLDLEYFPFDFNDDGLEDYLVCISSWGYCGSGGNSVRIYIQEEGGTLKKVRSITVPLHEYDGTHARFTILNEKTDGYYAIVLPGSNRILRYDSDTGRYEFHEGE